MDLTAAKVPADAVLEISELDGDDFKAHAELAAEALNIELSKGTQVKLFNITLKQGDKEIQPKGKVGVKVELKDDPIKDPKVVHFGEVTEVLDATASKDGNIVTFETSGFSVYAIVGKLVGSVLTADGKTLKVTVTYDELAEIPEGAVLEVKEIQENDEKWIDRSVQLADVLSDKYGNVTLSDVRFLSISIMVDGKEYEPKAPVQVKIEYSEPLSTEDTARTFIDELTGETIEPKKRNNRFAAIHYTESGAELVEAENKAEAKGYIETVYDVDGFSDYDLVYMYDYDTIEAKDDYDPSESIHTADIVNLAKAADSKAGGVVLRGAGDVPDHSKTLTDNKNGTYTIGLDVTGDADTEGTNASNANVIIVYDVSSSMIAPYNYVPMVTGGRGLDTTQSHTSYQDGEYFQLYRRNQSGTGYTGITDDTYSGTVYRRTGNPGRYTYNEYHGQRYSYSIDRASASEKVVYDFTNALFGYQNQDDPTNIQAAFITFSGSATNVTNGWTSNRNDILNRVSSTGTSYRLNYSNYTNWTAALQMAENLINSSATDDDPTYVVFITDGRPQTSSQSAAEPNYNASKVIAQRIESSCDETDGALYGIFAFANSDDWLASLLYYAYNNSDPSNPGTTFDTEGYYKASDTAALTQAINDIFQRIVQTLGVTEVSITDGTTTNVSTSTGVAHLLVVDNSYQYWLSFPVVAGTGGTYTFTMPDKTTGDPIVYTVTPNGENVDITWTDKDGNNQSVTYAGKVDLNQLTVEWTGPTSFYSYTPPTATHNSDTGAVDWNLNSVGTLLDGVTYTVTFDCYPSQETLDLIADLKNGDIAYSDLDPAIRQYLTADYKLETNTSATLTYTDTRTENGQQTSGFDNPDPQPVNATEALAVSKTWKNTLDSQTGWQSAVDLFVKRDGEEVHKVTLNRDNGWSASSFISFGLLTEDGGGVHLKTTGHDYSFSEEAVVGHNWVLKADTVRPMLINNEPTTLKLIDAEDAPSAITGATEDQAKAVVDGDTYYKLTIGSDVKYYVVMEGEINLTATNHRRSYLDVVKTVEGSNVPEGDKFPFTMKVSIADAESYDISDVNSDAWAWFSIADSNNNYTLIKDPDIAVADDIRWQLNDGSVTSTKPSASDFNGYFCVPSGTQVSIDMKTNYSVRFLNLPDGSTYTIAESETMPAEGYSFVSIAGERGYDADGDEETTEDWTTEDTGESSGQSITGTIEYVESAYKVTVTNKWSTIDVQLKKTKEDLSTTLVGSIFNLNKWIAAEGGGSWTSVQTDLAPGGSGTVIDEETGDETEITFDNPLDLGGLGIGRYQLVETKAPEGYVILTKNIYFEVYKEGSVLKARLTNEDGNPVESPTEYSKIEESGTDAEPVYTVSVKNTPGASLPSTGGHGTLPYTLGGLLLMLGSAMMYGFRMRRRERRYY
ncbi:MAG: VWA domain-containing protein [Lachnospiraceae bacterium]|nr:VWA domain-containing protein [Lachnospiraceae bacterium]